MLQYHTMKDNKVDMFEQVGEAQNLSNSLECAVFPARNPDVTQPPAEGVTLVTYDPGIAQAIQSFILTSIINLPAQFVSEIKSNLFRIAKKAWKNPVKLANPDWWIDLGADVIATVIVKSTAQETLNTLRNSLPDNFIHSDLPQWLYDNANSLIPADSFVVTTLFELINNTATGVYNYTPQLILDKMKVEEAPQDVAPGLFNQGIIAACGALINAGINKGLNIIFPQAMIAKLVVKTVVKVITAEVSKDAKAIGQRPVYFDGFGEGLEYLFNVPELNTPDAAIINQISYYDIVSEVNQIEEQNQAALTIQKVFRGHQGRKVAAEARAIQEWENALGEGLEGLFNVPQTQPKHSTAFYVCSTILGVMSIAGALAGLYYTDKMPTVLKEGLESVCSKATSLREYLPSMGVSR